LAGNAQKFRTPLFIRFPFGCLAHGGRERAVVLSARKIILHRRTVPPEESAAMFKSEQFV
jgi:hypothetical protein